MLMPRVLMIDSQVFQTDTWNRGMGKYTLALLSEAARKYKLGKEYKVLLITSSYLPAENERIKTVKALFDCDLCELPLLNLKAKNAREALAHNASVIDKYILEKYVDHEVWYLIPTPLDTSIYCSFPEHASRKLMLFYDLIPLLFSDIYLTDELTQQAYFSRYRSVFEADLIFTISQTTLNDVEQYLCLPSKRLYNIDGAPIPRSESSGKKPQLGLNKVPFVLMPSGDDVRKNNFRAAEAFAIFNACHQKKYKLVITSRFSKATQNQLRKFSSDIIFSGNVSEQELHWLYEKASVVLFVPEYEGLGLPVLEAVEQAKPIVCSDIAVFKEISDDAFFYADPYTVDSISNALNKALDSNVASQKKLAYDDILKKYNWSESARRFVEKLNQGFAKPNQETSLLKVAVLGPHPAGLSTIGKVIQQQHAELSELAHLTYYLEQSPTASRKKIAYLPFITETFSIEDFTIDVYKQYDIVIYHIGNSDYHIQTIRHALNLPGIAIIHDADMSDIMNFLYARGIISGTRFKAEEHLYELLPNNPKLKFATSLANSQIGIVVHSDYALQAARHSLLTDSIAVRKLSLPTPIISAQARPSRADSRLHIGLAGILHDVKGIGVLADILSSRTFNDCLFHVFGYDFVSKNSKLSAIRNYDNVIVEVNLSDLAFQQKLSKLDILLNYRPSYYGETSIVTLEALRCGVVPIVRDVGWFAELPNNLAVKVKEPGDVTEALRSLVGQPQKLVEMSQAAVEFVNSKHSLESYTHGLIQFVKETLNDDTPALGLMRTVKQMQKQMLTVDILTNPYH
jgi:glycosyltransferase involved in cell wall biosynthesis